MIVDDGPEFLGSGLACFLVLRRILVKALSVWLHLAQAHNHLLWGDVGLFAQLVFDILLQLVEPTDLGILSIVSLLELLHVFNTNFLHLAHENLRTSQVACNWVFVSHIVSIHLFVHLVVFELVSPGGNYGNLAQMLDAASVGRLVF